MSIHPPCEVLIRDESEHERCATPEPVSYSPLSSPAHSPRPTIDEREWTKSSEIPFDEPQIRKQDSRIDRGSHIQPDRPFSLRWEEKKEDDPPFARIRSVLPVCERTRPSYYRFQDDDDEDEVPMDEPRTVELTPENSARFNVSSGNKPEPREPESSASSESEHDDIDSTEPGEIPISWGNEALGEDDSGVHLLATSSDLGRSYDTTALQFTLPEHGASTQVIDEDKEAEDEDSWLADEMGTSHKRDAIFDALNTSTDSKLADELGTSHKRDATFDALNTSIDSKDSSEPGSCQVTKTDPMEIIDSEEASGNEDKSEEGSRISERPDESTGDAHPPTPMCKVEFSLDSIEVVSSGASFHERECVISPESLEDHNNESGNSSSDPLPSTPPPPLEPELQSSEELVTDVLALDPCISLEVVETGVQTPQILDGDIEASYAENVSEEPLPSHSESEDAPVPEPSEAGSTCFDLRIDVEPSEIQEPTECTSELMSSHSRDMSVHDPSCAESRASVEDNLVALESESDESRCGDTSFEFGITAHLKKDASQASISPVKLLCVDGSFFDMPSAVDTSFDDPPSLLEEATTADEDESDSILGALPLQRATFSEDDESDTELIVSLESMVSEIDAMAQERAKKMDSPSTQNTTTNESFSKNSTNNIDQSISSSQIIGAWAEERAVKMELSGTQNAPIDDSFSMTATYKTDQSDSCMMRMSTSDAEQGKEKEITTVQNTATHESLPRVSNYAIDPEPLVGGLPALVNPLCNEIGIPRGDAFLSTLCTIGAESSWKEKVSEALWRARSMRRNYDFEWIRDNILRKDGEPSYTKVDVDHSKVAGDSCVEDMEVAAIQHLKFDELPDARGLCEDILHRYADIDEQMQQDEGKRADMRPFISVAAYNLGLIQMLEGKFELARHSMKRSLNTVSIDPSNKQGIDRQSILAMLAICSTAMYEIDTACTLFRAALALVKESNLSLPGRSQLAELHNNLGCLLSLQESRKKEALAHFNKAQKVQNDVSRESIYLGSKLACHTSTLHYSVVQGNLGAIALSRQDTDHARMYLERAVRGQSLVLQNANNTLLASTDGLAAAHILSKRKEKALMLMTRSLEAQIENRGASHRLCQHRQRYVQLIKACSADDLEAVLKELPGFERYLKKGKKSALSRVLKPMRKKPSKNITIMS